MILNELIAKGKLTVRTIQPLIVYYKDNNSHSECYDRSRNKWLDIDDIDDSYGLDVMEESDDCVSVMIPEGRKCRISKSSPNVDCFLEYNNIELDLLFEDEPIDSFFEIVED